MVRTQIQLTEEQSRELKAIAAQEGISVAEAIRRMIDTSLAQKNKPTREEIRKRAIAAAGCGHSGLGDLSTRHDDYLEETYGR